MSLVYHNETECQSEVTDKVILSILHDKLLHQDGSWVEKIPHFQQAINSTMDAARGCTLNRLVLRFSTVNPNLFLIFDLPANRLKGLKHALWSSVQEKHNKSHIELTRDTGKKIRPALSHEIGQLVKIHHPAFGLVVHSVPSISLFPTNFSMSFIIILLYFVIYIVICLAITISFLYYILFMSITNMYMLFLMQLTLPVSLICLFTHSRYFQTILLLSDMYIYFRIKVFSIILPLIVR